MLQEFTSYLAVTGYANNTVETYTNDIKLAIKKGVIDEALSFFNEDNFNNLTVANSSKNRIYAALTKYSKFMLKKNLIEKSPIKNVDLPKIKTKVISTISFEKVMDLVKKYKDNKELKALLLLLYSTGCRIDSAANLKIEDVDFVQNTITFRVAKGDKQYISVLTAETKEAILNYIGKRTEGNVFKTNINLSPDALRLRMKRAMKEDYINPHKLRHSICTALIENDMDIYDVKEFMNHSNIQTTTRYIHMSAKTKERRLSKHHPMLIG